MTSGVIFVESQEMKKSEKIMVAVAVGLLTGLTIYVVRRSKERRLLNQLAEEGYETASDILFPNKERLGDKLHFGPVLPE